jgi:hypothetical protein
MDSKVKISKSAESEFSNLKDFRTPNMITPSFINSEIIPLVEKIKESGLTYFIGSIGTGTSLDEIFIYSSDGNVTIKDNINYDIDKFYVKNDYTQELVLLKEAVGIYLNRLSKEDIEGGFQGTDSFKNIFTFPLNPYGDIYTENGQDLLVRLEDYIRSIKDGYDVIVIM